MLGNEEIALQRIRERVAKGGHHIPEADARRRFSRSASNFLTLYSQITDQWHIYDNSKLTLFRVASSDTNGIQVFDASLFQCLKEYA